MDEEPLVDVSVDELFIVEDEDVSLLVAEPVPLAPMLDVLLLSLEFAVLLDVLGLEELLLYELLGVVLVWPADLLVSWVDEALVPPAPDVPADVPPVCATAMPPMASAAAAANVVSVFLVVVMSFTP